MVAVRTKRMHLDNLMSLFFVLFALYYKISSVACGIWIRRVSSHVRDKILQQERIKNVELCYENVR